MSVPHAEAVGRMAHPPPPALVTPPGHALKRRGSQRRRRPLDPARSGRCGGGARCRSRSRNRCRSPPRPRRCRSPARPRLPRLPRRLPRQAAEERVGGGQRRRRRHGQLQVTRVFFMRDPRHLEHVLSRAGPIREVMRAREKGSGKWGGRTSTPASHQRPHSYCPDPRGSLRQERSRRSLSHERCSRETKIEHRLDQTIISHLLG